MAAPDREFDVIIYGSTGYTGRLVAEYLAQTYRDGSVRWAMAGRNAEKLAAVRDEIGAPADIPFVLADAAEPSSLAAMAERTACIITTVGPYTNYGEPLVAACTHAGTHYVDLCGEPLWMHAMIPKYQDAAKASGARIVFSCGFDSIPFDLGVFYLQDEAKKRFGAPFSRIKGRVRKMLGTFSGGTAASFGETLKAVKADASLMPVLQDSFALTPGFRGPQQPMMHKPVEDEELGSWSAPFIMATINTKNIHRSNLLMGHPYGEDFQYDEMMFTGPGEKGRAVAEHVANANTFGDNPPKPGEGPTREEREAGYYEAGFYGTSQDGSTLVAVVTGDRDPGYGSTSKMLAEAGLCAVHDATVGGGLWTPASALGTPLIQRLQAKAGLTFTVET